MSKKNSPEPVSEDYRNLLDLQTLHADAVNALARLQAKADGALHDMLSEHRDTFAQLTVTVRDCEAALEVIARKHLEWFDGGKSIKTPFGSVKFHTSSELSIPNEELTLARLVDAIKARQVPATSVKLVEKINREALEGLDDTVLACLGIVRVAKNNFAAKPAKVNLGKAISAQDEAAAMTEGLGA